MVWGFPGSSSGKKIHLQCRRSQLDSWVGKFPRRRDRLPTPVFLSFSGGSDSKESAHNVGDLGSIPGLGRFPGGGHGNPLKHSCLETPHGQGSLAQYSPRGPKELDTTERLSLSFDLVRYQDNPSLCTCRPGFSPWVGKIP